MTEHKILSVAVPWSLSHYIPLNGFHPLYRALFDHAPARVSLNAWDNVKLHERFSMDIKVREEALKEMHALQGNSKSTVGSIGRAHQEYFWPPNRILTCELDGEIEFHHTAPYPTFERPFVFHCESFAPIFLPFSQQGSGALENHEEIRDYYRNIFRHPQCIGIFSHIPETLESFRRFFSDSEIDKKLFSSRIGLSSSITGDLNVSQEDDFSYLKFLFLNSANQNPENFFRRGGHLVLRFWMHFKETGRDGLLIMRCVKPSEKSLISYGVDVSFLRNEVGRSIIWIEDYLATYEVNALVASSHFFLLPSASLHSVSIMQAMASGCVPVVTDTVGTSVYVTDGEDGVVLQGVRDALWAKDPNTGILVDRYGRTPDLDNSLVSQLICRIFSLLDSPDTYRQIQERAIFRAKQQFSGDSFSSHFWDAVSGLCQYQEQLTQNRARHRIGHLLQDCALKNDGWARVFEGVTQPMPRIYTGQSAVWELGGAFVHIPRNQRMALNDWSVMAQYFEPGSPQITVASVLPELGGKYLSFYGGFSNGGVRKFVEFISAILMPFPVFHGQAGRCLKFLRRCRHYLFPRTQEALAGPNAELVLHGISGYNIVRCLGKFYAVIQSEGEFSLEKFRNGDYSSGFSGNSKDDVLRKILEQAAQCQSEVGDSVQAKLVLEGYHGFNVIQIGGDYHAILQREGAFDLPKLIGKRYSRSFSAQSLKEIQDAIWKSVNY